MRGTYAKLDDSVIINHIIRNRKLAPGSYVLDEEGQMLLTEDSTIVNAFRSWIENLSEDGAPLKFYIDGIGEYLTVVADGIEEIRDVQWTQDKAQEQNGERIVFDLSGRRMTAGQLPKGIYIINGKKVDIQT